MGAHAAIRLALSELGELPRPLPARYALALVVLLGEAGDARHGRWAARWAAQVTLAVRCTNAGSRRSNCSSCTLTLCGLPT